jgi:hypothetical protein
MGIFDSCKNIFFPMTCDIYYAEESQDDYGSINKSWNYYSTKPCNIYSASIKDSDNFSFEDQRFYSVQQTLKGRIKEDFRMSDMGEFRPVSHILITNICLAGCDTSSVFYETSEDFVTEPTVYEVSSLDPYVGPFGVEHYTFFLRRSDTQGLKNNAVC